MKKKAYMAILTVAVVGALIGTTYLVHIISIENLL